MVREQRGLPAAVVGGPKERHMRQGRPQFDPSAPVPEGFVAKLAVPKSKHHTYFEFVANKNKKKKLEYQVITKKEPPPGFEFVPIGNPDLTTACKEISREKDAMIFIVSTSKAGASNHLSGHIHRIGHHIRETIVEEAKASLQHFSQLPVVESNGEPEPIPDSQEEYHAQADAAIRDLFPRIPNTDRQSIIDHSFTRGNAIQSAAKEPPVGLSQDITLARRVQLAVLAHIRHSHTRYDQLLKETSWQNARKVVEQLCLDTLVQWRGDEETGRDQLDEILREVIIISDSETGDSDDETTDDTSAEETDLELAVAGPSRQRRSRPQTGLDTPMETHMGQPPTPENAQSSLFDPLQQGTKTQRRNQRGFKRYRAWEEAIRRNREVQDYPTVMDTDTVYSAYLRQQPLHSVTPVQSNPRSGFIGYVSPRPITPPSKDIPLPSIEPVSPQTMEPSFIRAVPVLEPQQPESWNSQVPYQVNPPARHSPFTVASGPPLHQPGAPPLAPAYPYQAPYGTEVYSRGIRQVHDVQPPAHTSHFPADPWPVQGSNAARRIIMDANRPGERSNPIVMEDRGGFFERVSLPVPALEAPILVREREIRRWSRPPEPYGYRQYARRDSPMIQDHDMEDIETYPAPRETNMIPQYWGQYQPGAPPMPIAASNHRDHGAIHIRSVSQPDNHVDYPGGFPSPQIKAAGAEMASMRTDRPEDMGTGHRQFSHHHVGTGEGT
ncbi:hypothetical protein PWT90_09120 [Aphanocladium album]|nr:hypothetical protein PWT90_09120 [Aphanocladium album]